MFDSSPDVSLTREPRAASPIVAPLGGSTPERLEPEPGSLVACGTGDEEMKVLYRCCCGLDVHARTVVACLIRDGKKQALTFSMMTTDDLLVLLDWLSGAGLHARCYLYMATVAEVYHLPLRATEGLMLSVIKLLGAELTVPDYTTLCRRRQVVEVVLLRREKTEPLHMAVDSTGLKVYGEGEWKVRQHGYGRRRTWRKLHFGLDEATHEFVAVTVTTNDFKDSQLRSGLQTAFALLHNRRLAPHA
jgi:hypothetical protein